MPALAGLRASSRSSMAPAVVYQAASVTSRARQLCRAHASSSPAASSAPAPRGGSSGAALPAARCLQRRGAGPMMAPTGSPRHSARRVVAYAEPDESAGAFPWDDSEYHKVEFVKEPYGPVAIDSAGSQWRGVLLFQVAGQPEPVDEETRVMEIFISGDACISIYTHLCPSDNTRPMALDILWQMWQRGKQISKRDWTLLRVAVVACVNDVYYGRLFFGDPDTQQVLWDTDVRPSDATFLALKANAPIYIKKSVWEACSTPLRNSSTWTTVAYLEQQREAGRRAASGGSSGSERHGSGSSGSSSQREAAAAAAAGLTPESLPAIRLLMREMEVAVREEDYGQAARLRDHPWMRLAEDINMHRSIGYYDQAYKLMSDLRALIESHESAMGREYEARLSAQHEARAQLDDLLRRQQQQAAAAQQQQQQQDEEEGEGSGVQQNESTGKRD